MTEIGHYENELYLLPAVLITDLGQCSNCDRRHYFFEIAWIHWFIRFYFDEGGSTKEPVQTGELIEKPV